MITEAGHSGGQSHGASVRGLAGVDSPNRRRRGRVAFSKRVDWACGSSALWLAGVWRLWRPSEGVPGSWAGWGPIRGFIMETWGCVRDADPFDSDYMVYGIHE